MAAAVLPFFARDKEFLRAYSFDPSKEGALVERTEVPFPLPAPKAALWSPDGLALALVDPTAGAQVLTLSDVGKDTGVHSLGGCPRTTQGFLWSPRGSFLVTMAPGAKGNQDANVHVWRQARADDGSEEGGYVCQASFCYQKLERDKKVLQWTPDECICARALPDGHIHILDGTDLTGAPLAELTLAHGVQSFEFAPLRPRGSVKARLGVFVPDCRDDLQRVVGPAEVTIWELSSTGVGLQLQVQERAKQEVTSGQVADLLWNSTGSALIAHCQTEVDESGQSYYGGSRLVLLSHDGEYKKDLTEADPTANPNGTSVQAIAWSPTRDEFILISGFQPAQAALWSWDERAKKVTLAKVLLEKAHRNTIRFNQFGSLVCLAGFGNLAGQVDFFGRPEDDKCDFVRVSSCQANCTVSAEWAPDGRHFLTAVLAPRMRVDNGCYIWHALAGAKVSGMEFEELYETQWRPEPPNSLRFLDVSFDEIESASKELASRGGADGAEKKRQAYRPPKARGEGASTVAAMMRGEVAAPDADDRRARKPRQPRPREEEQVQPSPHAEVRETRAADPTPWGEQAPQAEPEFWGAVPDLPDQRPQLAAVPPREEKPVPPTEMPPPPAEALIAGRNKVREAGPGGAGGYPVSASQHPVAARPPPAQQQQQQLPPQRAPQQQPQQQQQVPRPAPSQPAKQQPGIQGHGTKLPCPTTGWQYVDPKQKIQGPFTLLEMQQWNSMGYFRPDLPMRCDTSDAFVPFAELYPHPLIPFQSYPNRPPSRLSGLR